MERKLSKTYFRLALPVVLSMVITLVYNLADTWFVAATDNTDLVAGVSLCAPILTIQMAFGNIFAQGGCTLTSRLLGGGRMEDIKRVSSFCIYSGYLIGIVLGVFFLIFHSGILLVLGADADTTVFAQPYYIWLSLGTPFIVASYVYTNLFRAEGMAMEAMIGSSIGAVLNLILDPVLILYLGMGAKGAAIATVLGYILANVYCIFILLKKSRILSLAPKQAGISGDYLRQVLGIGIPASIMNIVQSISVIFLNQFLLPYGNEKIAAMGIAFKAVSIVNLVLVGLAYGGQPMFGYLIGASQRKRLRELFRFNLAVMIIVAVVLSSIVFAAAPAIVRFFMSQPQIVADGSRMLRFQVVTMTLAGVVLLLTLVFQSAGRIAISFVLSIARQGFIFLTVLFLMSWWFGYEDILAAQAAADCVSVCFAGILFYHCIYRSWIKEE
ncbi:MAG: MATE family efflux transporter [Clostridiales bacterium]|nr:MATE family efflux transporter [Clostridiales bacterium]